jgi:hypothetical protein
MEPYYLYFTLLLTYSVFGIYVFIKKKSDINLKEIVNLFMIMFVFRIFDLLSTVFFISKLGIEAEANLIAKNLMNSYGVYYGLFLSSLILFPLTFFLFVAANYSLKNTRLGWAIFKIVVLVVCITVPIINLAVPFQV